MTVPESFAFAFSACYAHLQRYHSGVEQSGFVPPTCPLLYSAAVAGALEDADLALPGPMSIPLVGDNGRSLEVNKGWEDVRRAAGDRGLSLSFHRYRSQP